MTQEQLRDRPVLEGEGIRLRPIVSADLGDILRILSDPSVARWWGNYSEERVRKEYEELDDNEGVFLIETGGEVAGLIQYSEELSRDYRHAAVDIAISGNWQAQGIGPRAIRLLAAYLFEARGHHRLTIDPAAANENAIRAYAKVGFRHVGVMRRYERGAAGTWHDGLLMDMLAEDFRG